MKLKMDFVLQVIFYIIYNLLLKQKIDMGDECFYFEAKSFEEKEGWIGAIGKAMIKGSNIVIDN